MKRSSVRLKSIAIAFLSLIFVLALVAAATTKTTRTASGMRFFENRTLRFMISVVPDPCVDVSGRRFWIAQWPGGAKCIAGINIPAAGQQFTFHLLR